MDSGEPVFEACIHQSALAGYCSSVAHLGSNNDNAAYSLPEQYVSLLMPASHSNYPCLRLRFHTRGAQQTLLAMGSPNPTTTSEADRPG